MKINIITLYEVFLAVLGYIITAWTIVFLSKEYSTPVSLKAFGFMCLAGAVMTAWLWYSIGPKSRIVKMKIVLYGFLSGFLIGLGLYGWGGWLPPIP